MKLVTMNDHVTSYSSGTFAAVLISGVSTFIASAWYAYYKGKMNVSWISFVKQLFGCSGSVPKSAQWLAVLAADSEALAKKTGEPRRIPALLRWPPQSGLKPLPAAEWLVVDHSKAAYEMTLKKRLLFGSQRDTFWVQPPGDSAIVDAGREVLNDTISHFKKYEPGWVQGSLEAGRVALPHIGLDFAFDIPEFSEEPLLLASLLCQEDFILLRERSPGSFVFEAGSACFSFTDVGLRGEYGFMKPGADLPCIHKTVPGFNECLLGRVSAIFQSLPAGGPGQFRTNWMFTPNKALSPYEDEGYVVSRSAGDDQPVMDISNARPDELYYRVEFQSIRRLRKNPDFLLFTLHTYIDPLSSLLRKAPQACRLLADVCRVLTPKQLEYRAMSNGKAEEIALYLEGFPPARWAESRSSTRLATH